MTRRRDGEWTASEWGPTEAVPAEAAPLEWGPPADAEPPPTVSFTVSGSVLFPTEGPLSLLCARRAMVGGQLARCWVAATIGGTLREIDFGHGGSAVDPRDWVTELEDAERTFVDLGSVAVDAEAVATAIVDALALDEIEAAAEDAGSGRWRVTITDATDLVVPPNVDTTDVNLRGLRGALRDDWGAGGGGQALNSDGGSGGTGTVHVGPQGSDGRVLAVYLWTRTDTVPQVTQLGASSGPAYDPAPGAMTILGQAEATIQGFGLAPLGVVAFLGADVLWAHYASATATAGIRYRAHGQDPPGHGDLGEDEVLIWDTTRDPSLPLPSSYTPTVDATFTIYVMIGLVVEHPDLAGNYPANGRWLMRVGDQNPNPLHGTQFSADSSILAGENTGHRIELPSWPQLRLLSVRRAMLAIGADEDCRLGIYQYDDLDIPSSTPAALVADLGNMGIDVAEEYVEFELPDGGLEMGTATIAGSRYFALTFNYIRDGGALAVATLGVFLESAGDGYFGNAWTDGRYWHDYIPGAAGIAPASGLPAGIEYRTRESAGNTGQPVTWGATYPDPMDPTGADSPAALPADSALYEIDGIQAD